MVATRSQRSADVLDGLASGRKRPAEAMPGCDRRPRHVPPAPPARTGRPGSRPAADWRPRSRGQHTGGGGTARGRPPLLALAGHRPPVGSWTPRCSRRAGRRPRPTGRGGSPDGGTAWEVVWTMGLGAGHLLALGGYKEVLRGQYAAQYAATGQGMDAFKPWFWLPAAASVAYLAVVHFGNRAMATRKPFSCKGAMISYNFYQVVFNTWVVGGFLREMTGFGGVAAPKFWGNRPDQSPAGFEVSFFIWMHYINKYSELLDTVFMMLRKKTQQMSFLHVYHHTLLIWSWALVTQVSPGGDCYFGACVNSFVHILMYAYYLMAALKIPCPWKRYLTQFQMFQFCACAAQSLWVVVWGGNAPKILAYAQLFVMLNMLYLFNQFYKQRYGKAKAEARGKAA